MHSYRPRAHSGARRTVSPLEFRLGGKDTALESCVLILSAAFHANPAVTNEGTGMVKHRFPADQKVLLRTISIDPTEFEFQEWLPSGNLCLQIFSLCRIPPKHLVIAGVTHKGLDPDAEHFQDRTADLGEFPSLVLLPVPIGGQFRQAAITRFTFAQFRCLLLNHSFQRVAVTLKFSVQQP